MNTLTGSYDAGLVVLSILTAILAAGAALDLAGRVTATTGPLRTWWLVGGALAMGLGIWSMHYTGMHAFRLAGIDVLYHLPTVLLSLLAAIIASVVALYVASRQQLGVARTIGGSIVMGSGIAAMHYIGMAAMRLPATVRWNPLTVAASIAIAIVVSAVALQLAFRFGQERQSRWTSRRAAAMLIMGLAIATMHYTGMAAATFIATPTIVAQHTAVEISTLGTVGIATVTLVVLVMAIGTALVARYGEERLRASIERQRESERQLAEAQEIAHVGSWELDLATNRVTWSDKLYRMWGVPPGSPVGYNLFLSLLHSEDRARVEALVNESLAQGRNVEYEYRMIHPDGTTRHYFNRNVVTTDRSGKPIRFAGTALDITERKRNEEALRAALQEVKTLRGYLRVCANCRRVLTHAGDWEQLESYVRRYTEAEFSHGICPDCAKSWT